MVGRISAGISSCQQYDLGEMTRMKAGYCNMHEKVSLAFKGYAFQTFS